MNYKDKYYLQKFNCYAVNELNQSDKSCKVFQLNRIVATHTHTLFSLHFHTYLYKHFKLFFFLLEGEFSNLNLSLCCIVTLHLRTNLHNEIMLHCFNCKKDEKKSINT